MELYEKRLKQDKERILLLKSQNGMKLQHEHQGKILKKDQGMAVFKSNLSNTEKV